MLAKVPGHRLTGAELLEFFEDKPNAALDLLVRVEGHLAAACPGQPGRQGQR